MMGELTSASRRRRTTTASIGAIVVTGAGRGLLRRRRHRRRVRQGPQGEPPPEPAPPERRGTDWVALCRESKPMIAAINGASIGVGLTLVLPFDQILAAKGAKLSARFVKMGLVPELASSHFLDRPLRVRRGVVAGAQRRHRAGRGGQGARPRRPGRASPTRCSTRRWRWPTELAGNPPTQLRLIKALLSANAGETDLAAVQRRELEALNIAYQTPEHAEAVAAFMERRPPVFR